jgi:hypothetical protein
MFCAVIIVFKQTKLRIGNVKKELQAEIRATKQLQFELSLRGPMSACSVAAVVRSLALVHPCLWRGLLELTTSGSAV